MEGRYQIQEKRETKPEVYRPFKIIERIGKVAYRLELPEELTGIHGTFHVSQLRKCLAEETTYIHYNDIEVDNNLNYAVRPLEIQDQKVKHLRNKRIDQVKIKWEHRKASDTTWESEEEMQRLYPTLFVVGSTASVLEVVFMIMVDIRSLTYTMSYMVVDGLKIYLIVQEILVLHMCKV
ncbi:uncharacterized protein LOC110875856 [Helianthus annuus]|uniref:uncharacterized protein LOC110875856 n=1 Tax=Helianthus annuus TaxID=4232 RepID=UPI000B8FC69E|nr:uncharacterized protein LOC110875856 [Helianthus annuus]